MGSGHSIALEQQNIYLYRMNDCQFLMHILLSKRAYSCCHYCHCMPCWQRDRDWKEDNMMKMWCKQNLWHHRWMCLDTQQISDALGCDGMQSDAIRCRTWSDVRCGTWSCGNGLDSIRHEWLGHKWIQCTDHVGKNAKERQSTPKQLDENNQDKKWRHNYHNELFAMPYMIYRTKK